MSEDIKQYYLDNKEHIKKQQKQYYIENREAILEREKQYRKNNPKLLRLYNKQRRKIRRQYINDYKSSRGCKLCGYNKCAEALVFHHPNDDKKFGISELTTHSLEKLKKEMAKCEVLCANCHREVHTDERL